MREKPPASCPWSISGPQFARPTAIQQRYCYPKGDTAYSSRMGGALWTMYTSDGRENLDYRLLHVYFSTKRVFNKAAAAKPKEVSQLADGRPRSAPTLPVAAPEPPHHVDGSRQDPHSMDSRPSPAPYLPTTRYKTTGSSPDLLNNLTTGDVSTIVPGSNRNTNTGTSTGQSDPTLFRGLVDACSTSLLNTSKPPNSVTEEAQRNNSIDGYHALDVTHRSSFAQVPLPKTQPHIESRPRPKLEKECTALSVAPRGIGPIDEPNENDVLCERGTFGILITFLWR
jgi:hypothetical protein